MCVPCEAGGGPSIPARKRLRADGRCRGCLMSGGRGYNGGMNKRRESNGGRESIRCVAMVVFEG